MESILGYTYRHAIVYAHAVAARHVAQDALSTGADFEQNSAFRVPTFVRWPGHWQEGVTLNGIVSHEDWLPTFAAVAGDTDVKERLLKGTKINGRKYRNHLDGYNLLDYLSGKTDQNPNLSVCFHQERSLRCVSFRTDYGLRPETI